MRESPATAYDQTPLFKIEAQHLHFRAPGETKAWLPASLINRDQISRSAAATGKSKWHNVHRCGHDTRDGRGRGNTQVRRQRPALRIRQGHRLGQIRTEDALIIVLL